MGLKYFSLGADRNEYGVFLCMVTIEIKIFSNVMAQKLLIQRSYASNLIFKMVHSSLSFLFYQNCMT